MNEPYIINDDNAIRYVLGKYNNKPMVVFGINPSTATNDKSDTTISKVSSFAQRYGFDGYVMLNVYPVRATQMDGKTRGGAQLSHSFDKSIHEENLCHISQYISKECLLVAAWGVSIRKRAYFMQLLRDINEIAKEKGVRWHCFGKTKAGHPSHPSRLPYNNKPMDFDIDAYLGGC